MDNLSQSRSPFVELLIFLAIALTSMVVFSFLGMAIVYMLYGITAFDFSNPDDVFAAKIMQFFNAAGLFIFPPAIYFRWIKRQSWFIVFKGDKRIILLLVTVVLTYAALPAIEWLAQLNAFIPLPETWQTFITQMDEQTLTATKAMLQMRGVGDFLFTVIIIGVLPAIGEELFFRGVLQRILIRWTGSLWSGVLITAFLFSVLHLEFSGILPRFALGVILGLLYAWSNNLTYSVILHFFNNASVVLYIYFNRIDVNQLSDLEILSGATWYAGVLSVLCIVGLMYVFYRLTVSFTNKSV